MASGAFIYSAIALLISFVKDSKIESFLTTTRGDSIL